MRLIDLPSSEAKSASFRDKRAQTPPITCGVTTLVAGAGGAGATVRAIRVTFRSAGRFKFRTAFPSTHSAVYGFNSNDWLSAFTSVATNRHISVLPWNN
jgi:hypothetical protein